MAMTLPLPDRHDALVGQPGQNLHAGSHALDYGGSDEDRVDRAIAQDAASARSVSNESSWRPKALRLDRDVEQREDGLLAAGDLRGQDDHAGARAQDGRARSGPAP